MRYAIAALLVVMSFALQGQDLIVTISGDSIQCAISSVAPNRLLYTVKAADGATDRRDILLSSVAMYKREGYFPVILGAVA